MPTLGQMIDNLGAELVNCCDECSGIWQDQGIGVIPPEQGGDFLRNRVAKSAE